MGRNSTACLKQMQPKLLIHRTYCWSPRRSQLATCRRADTSSCLSPRGRRSIRISVALQNILVDLCEVQSMLFLKKQTLTVYKMHRLEKMERPQTEHFSPAAFIAAFTHLLFSGKYVLMGFRTAACHSQPLPSNYSWSCCFL